MLGLLLTLGFNVIVLAVSEGFNSTSRLGERSTVEDPLNYHC